jgi:uncharacterized phage protein (TIGR02220 family)
MARIRYLNPEFFLDEDINLLPFEVRLTFQGLWCYADREGRLEDRPVFLKAVLFPYDESVDVESCLKALSSARKPFIARYEVKGKQYIQILNFHKYQRPHHTERTSVIPRLKSIRQYTNSTIRIDTYKKDKDKGASSELDVKERLNNGALTVKVDEIFGYFISKVQRNLKLNTERKQIIIKRIKEGRTVEEMKTAIDNFCLDDWPDRYKFTDLVYAIGKRKGIDNLDKWLNFKPKESKAENPLDKRKL